MHGANAAAIEREIVESKKKEQKKKHRKLK